MTRREFISLKMFTYKNAWNIGCYRSCSSNAVFFKSIKNKKKDYPFSLPLRFDHYVKYFIETYNISKKTQF
jgi:hypothetical protein